MQWRLKKIWPVVATCILATNFTHADLDTSLIPNLENCPTAVDLDNSTSSDLESCPAAVDLDNSISDLESCPAAVDLDNSILTDLENRLINMESIQETMNPAAMPLTRNGWDCQISADALLWQLQEDGLIPAIEATPTGLPIGSCSIKQKYNWGFRIGLDWTIPHDNWDIAATWTHVISNQHGNCNARSNILIKKQGVASYDSFDFEPEGTPLQPTTANAKYHNRLDQIGLNLGREFFISKWATLRPYFGLRADCLCQRLRTLYSGVPESPMDRDCAKINYRT